MVRCILCFLLVLVAGIRIPVTAAQYGSIQVFMDYGEPVSGGEIALYPVARPIDGGYRLEQAYGGGVIRQNEANSAELAQWLSERTPGEGKRCVPDAQGYGTFRGLSEGLYLLIQTSAPTGWACVSPFLVSIPMDGQWEILARPKQAQLMTESPKTGQHPAPIYASMGLVLSGIGVCMCVDKLRKK